MATIEQRTTSDGKTSFRVRIRLKGRPALTATFERKTDAREWARNTERDLKRNRLLGSVEAQRHTLAEMVDKYINDALPGLKSARDRERHLAWWKAQIGAYTLADVTAPMIVDCREKLAREEIRKGVRRSPGTVNRYLAALSHTFTVARTEWHWVRENPLRDVSTLKEPRGRVRFLSDDERKRLLFECKAHSPELYAIVVLALSTGARQGELLNLRWQTVDLNRGLIVLEDTKNGERRGIPLQGHARDLIRDLGKVRRIDSDLLFPSRRYPDKAINIQKIWERAVARAEIADFRFHDLRHSTDSHLAMNGASLA